MGRKKRKAKSRKKLRKIKSKNLNKRKKKEPSLLSLIIGGIGSTAYEVAKGIGNIVNNVIESKRAKRKLESELERRLALEGRERCITEPPPWYVKSYAKQLLEKGYSLDEAVKKAGDYWEDTVLKALGLKRYGYTSLRELAEEGAIKC